MGVLGGLTAGYPLVSGGRETGENFSQDTKNPSIFKARNNGGGGVITGGQILLICTTILTMIHIKCSFDWSGGILSVPFTTVQPL